MLFCFHTTDAIFCTHPTLRNVQITFHILNFTWNPASLKCGIRKFFVESAFQRREEAWQRPRWLPNKYQWRGLAHCWPASYQCLVELGGQLSLCPMRRQSGGIKLVGKVSTSLMENQEAQGRVSGKRSRLQWEPLVSLWRTTLQPNSVPPCARRRVASLWRPCS